MEQQKKLTEVFDTGAIAKLNREQLRSYEDSLKYYRDLKNSMDTARDEGREEGIGIGREEGIRSTARSLIEQGVSDEIILQATGLTAEQLEQLRRET